MSVDPHWLNRKQVARRLSLSGSTAFDGLWDRMVEASEAGGAVRMGGKDVSLYRSGEAWVLPRADVPAVEAEVASICLPKGTDWLDAKDIRMHVPGDCEKTAKRIWGQVLAFAAEARVVSVEGQRLHVERRLTGTGAEPCLSRDSVPLFMRAVRNSVQKQVERQVARMMEEPAFRM